jgi:hypothetical protein
MKYKFVSQLEMCIKFSSKLKSSDCALHTFVRLAASVLPLLLCQHNSLGSPNVNVLTQRLLGIYLPFCQRILDQGL